MLVDLEFILPVWNREHEVRDALETMVACLRKLSVRGGVAVVDRGSSDRTLEMVDGLAAGSPVPVRTMGCSRAGWHAAVLRGIATTPAPWVALGDPDATGALEHAVRMLHGGRHMVRAGAATVLDAAVAGAVIAALEPDGPELPAELPDTVDLAGLRVAALGLVPASAPVAVETTAILDRVAA